MIQFEVLEIIHKFPREFLCSQLSFKKDGLPLRHIHLHNHILHDVDENSAFKTTKLVTSYQSKIDRMKHILIFLMFQWIEKNEIELLFKDVVNLGIFDLEIKNGMSNKFEELERMDEVISKIKYLKLIF